MHPAQTAVRNAARSATRSIRDDRVSHEPRMEVRRNETVRDDVEDARGTEDAREPEIELSIIDPSTGRFRELTARQMTAIHLLTMGKSVVATAASIGVGVSTLHRWKSKHPAFVAELNRRQHELFDQTVGKLRTTMAKAVDELFTLMSSRNPRDRYEVAMKLLPMLSPRRWVQPTGPTEPEAVVDEQVREQRRERGEDPAAEITEAERDVVIRAAEGAEHTGHPEERSDEGSGGSGEALGGAEAQCRGHKILRSLKLPLDDPSARAASTVSPPTQERTPDKPACVPSIESTVAEVVDVSTNSN